jgi:hypothetical protein
MTQTSILRALFLPNPSINNERTLEGTNTKDTAWPDVKNIRLWEEFNYDTLNDLYGDVLTAR